MTTRTYRFGEPATFTSTFDGSSEPVTYIDEPGKPGRPEIPPHRVRSVPRGVIFSAYTDELTHRPGTQE
jgi:hypothetical protein